MVATALQILDEDGADALSMRTLAQRLGSGTATLYRHFDGRTDLISHVVDRVFGEIDLTADELGQMDWRDACTAFARKMFDALSRHRNLAPLLVEQVPTGPNAMLIRELYIAVLLDNGFPPALAARSYATLAHYVLGFAIQLIGQGTGIQGDLASLTTDFEVVDAARFPATAAVAASLPVALEDEFAFGLELIINGLGAIYSP